MRQFLVTAQPVAVTAYRLQYVVEASTPKEAEEIFRNPEAHPGRMRLVHQEKDTSQPKRETLPVVVESLSRITDAQESSAQLAAQEE